MYGVSAFVAGGQTPGAACTQVTEIVSVDICLFTQQSFA